MTFIREFLLGERLHNSRHEQKRFGLLVVGFFVVKTTIPTENTDKAKICTQHWQKAEQNLPAIALPPRSHPA